MEPENVAYSILGCIHPLTRENYYKIITKDNHDPQACWVELHDGPIFSELDHARIFVIAYASGMNS